MALVRVLEGEELAGRVAEFGALGLTKEQIAAAVGLPDAVIARRLGRAGYRLRAEYVVRDARTGQAVRPGRSCERPRQ